MSYFNEIEFIRTKAIVLITLLLVSTCLHAKNYYVSATGNNSNDGLSPATAWQTISQVNSFKFKKNDHIFFRRGDTFYGSLVIKLDNQSIGAYGSGDAPIISGLSPVTGWVNLGGNIWEAPVSDVKPGVNVVLRDDIVQQVGRYPNADAENGGYLTYTAATNTSITGPALSSSTNWKGAEVAIKQNRWSIIKQKVTAHNKGVVSFEALPEIPRINYGYFFQRDRRTLDKDGEWWYNIDRNRLRMYFSSNNPALFTVEVATVDTLLRCQNRKNVVISDLAFDGAEERAIWVAGSSSITITNCTIRNSGSEALTIKSSTNVTIDKCDVNNSLGGGINVSYPAGGKVNFLVQNCTVTNTAIIAGMETSTETGEAIKCAGGDNVQVLYNKVINCGYAGIRWQGNNVYVKYNLVDRFCTVRDDGSGIYTFEEADKRSEKRSNRNVISNIVVNGMGNNQGTNNSLATSVQGLYFDNGTKNVLVDSNTVAYIANNALHGNNCSNLVITNNLFFDNGRTSSLQRFAGAELIRKITMKKNILYPYLFKYTNLGINEPSMTKESDIRAMGAFDSNYYCLGRNADRLATITTNADATKYKEEYFKSDYLTGTVGIEKNSTEVDTSGILEYNASSTPRKVSFPGSGKKDVFGKIYKNSVTIPAWSSKLLLPVSPSEIANKAPVADAGPAKSIKLPVNTVTLSGSGTDPEGGTISKYSWTKISGPAGATISAPLGAVTAILGLIEGTYQFELAVTDAEGAVGKDTVQVTVNSPGYTLLPAVNPSPVTNGLDYRYYKGSWLKLPDFSSLTPKKTGTVLNFDLSPSNETQRFGFTFSGFIQVPEDGLYTFYTRSDDGTKLLIDNVLVVSNDGLHGPLEQSGTIGLKAGKHAITGLFFQRGGGSVFDVRYESDNIGKRRVPSSALYRRTQNTAARVAVGQSVAAATTLNIIADTIAREFKIRCFPNPTATAFTLNVQGGITAAKLSVTVVDLSGRIVYQRTGTTSQRFQFGEKFVPGIYLLRISQNNLTQTFKLVKNR